MKKQKGQALLIILLIMAVVLTIALSVVSKSVTDISISRKEEEAARAFSAAEAGVEQGLKGITAGNSLSSGGSFAINVSSLVANGTDFVYPANLFSGETATIWFVAHDAQGAIVCDANHSCTNSSSITMTVCWGEDGTISSNTSPAVEVSVLYTSTPGAYDTTKIARKVYDSNAARISSNGFGGASGSCTVDGQRFAFSKDINLGSDMNIASSVLNSSGGLQLSRIKLLYNTDRAHPLGIKISSNNSAVLPAQGQKIDSTGTAGDSSRKMEAFQLFPDIPPVFDFGLFSNNGDLAK